MTIKVIATERGYYGDRIIDPGNGNDSEFTINNAGEYSAEWMELHPSVPSDVADVVLGYVERKRLAIIKFKKAQKKSGPEIETVEIPILPGDRPTVSKGNNLPEDQQQFAVAEPTMDQKIKGVLWQLEHRNDNHWDDDGKPSISIIEVMTQEMGVTRADIDSAAPGFERQVQVAPDGQDAAPEDDIPMGDGTDRGEVQEESGVGSDPEYQPENIVEPDEDVV